MDEQYIRQVLDGNTEAFRFLIAKYKDFSYSIAMSILKSELQATEAVQDAFVKAYQNLEAFRGKSRFSTWLYRIVVNESLRKTRHKKLELSGTLPGHENLPDAGSDILSSMHEVEQKEIVNDILQKMPATESLLLRLFYLEETNISETAKIAGLSESNVKVILHRARKRFHSLLVSIYKTELKTIL